ncbi:MAG TPA: response regulator [Chthoniobacterales bacterium]|jgi:DNA-binding response OmpR family regulator
METAPSTVEFLVADDDPRVARFLSAYLESKQHTSVSLTDGTGILSWLETNHCEVVIIDINFPKQDGISLISSIRSADQNLPIIVFTGLGYDEEKMHAALRAGANGYVSKNLPAEQLYSVLSRVLMTTRTHARRDARLTSILSAV